jgi:hypothetical protein
MSFNLIYADYQMKRYRSLNQIKEPPDEQRKLPRRSYRRDSIFTR